MIFNENVYALRHSMTSSYFKINGFFIGKMMVLSPKHKEIFLLFMRFITYYCWLLRDSKTILRCLKSQECLE